jgi:molybdate transport system substrate-binding protein
VFSRRSVLAALALSITALLVQAKAAEDKAITVFAAASMKNALDEVDALFTKQSSINVAASYAASSALMKQIEQGAPADIFLSADIQWMDYGVTQNLIKKDSRENLLGNRLVLIASKDSKIDKVTIAPGFDLPGAYRKWPHCHGGCTVSSGRSLRQSRTGKARCLVECGTEIGNG